MTTTPIAHVFEPLFAAWPDTAAAKLAYLLAIAVLLLVAARGVISVGGTVSHHALGVTGVLLFGFVAVVVSLAVG